jgi:hypothetical protein
MLGPGGEGACDVVARRKPLGRGFPFAMLTEVVMLRSYFTSEPGEADTAYRYGLRYMSFGTEAGRYCVL